MKHIIFDFDGTLADSTAVFASAWNIIAKKISIPRNSIGRNRIIEKKLSIAERSKLFNFPMYKLPTILPQFYRYYRQSLKDVILIDGMKNVLKEIVNKAIQSPLSPLILKIIF